MSEAHQNGRRRGLALSGLRVKGFKSIRDSGDVELRQLTVLAGANSTGKSSLMQPLLLLKQTMEAPFDPGPLRLGGPNVKFTKLEEALSRCSEQPCHKSFSVRVTLPTGAWIEEEFGRGRNGQLEIAHARFSEDGREGDLHEGMRFETEKEIVDVFGHPNRGVFELQEGYELAAEVIRQHCWLTPVFRIIHKSQEAPQTEGYIQGLRSHVFQYVAGIFSGHGLLHVPAARGVPERTYEVAAIGDVFAGLFTDYVAGLVAAWSNEGSPKRRQLGDAMAGLGLACQVGARETDDTRVELLVGTTSSPSPVGSPDVVNLADVGFGVSQVLPVVVALVAAKPGQLLYIEEPEIHLHPKAQQAMAGIIADAAKRGVQVVIETHSELILLGLQTLVAKGELVPELVKLHWFERAPETGETTITPADLGGDGSFGDWPEDFGKVSLDAQRKYLDASHK